MTERPRDLKFSEAANVSGSYRELSVTTEMLKPVAAAFVANVDRALALIEFAPHALGILDEVHLKLAAARNGTVPLSEPTIAQWRETNLLSGYQTLELWCAAGSWPDIHIGMQTLLEAEIAAVWTAFETLSGDLWEESLNSHPRGLSDLKGKERPSKIKSAGQSAKTISETAIDDGMGSRLRSHFHFSGLGGIRTAYQCAFHERCGAINQALNNSALDVLSAVRNLLVHKVGICDDKYLALSNSINTLPKLEIGQQLKLDGGSAARFTGPAIACATDLLLAVDKWIMQSAKKNV
jgi:hypothetical protein